MGITLITPTGGRPEAFELLEKYIADQTYSGPIQWIVVDDCEPRTRCTMGQYVIHPEPSWSPGMGNTQYRNLLAALSAVDCDRILIIEDEDVVRPGYLAMMRNRLEVAPIVGEVDSLYYNVRWRLAHECKNKAHSSLCQTGFRAEGLHALEAACKAEPQYIDMYLWEKFPQLCRLFPYSATNVGIKGMPGRGGAGGGHFDRRMNAEELELARWTDDANMEIMRCWLGPEAEAYMKFYEGA